MASARAPVRVLLALVGVIGVIAIAMIASDDHDLDRTPNLIGSAISLAGASLLVMASLLAWNHPRARVLGRICLVTTGFALVGLLANIWKQHPSDLRFQLMLTALFAALASGHLVIVAQSRLAPRYQWTWPAILACDALIVVFALALIWRDGRGDTLIQLISVLVVVASALTIAVVAFHYLSRAAAPRPGAGDGDATVRFCPGCGHALWHPAGEIRCRHCERVFLIEARDGQPPATATAHVRG